MVTQGCDDIDVGTPFYAPAWRPARPAIPIPGDLGAGPPALHKFDQTDFVRRFLSEASDAAQNGTRPASLLRKLDELTAAEQTVDTLELPLSGRNLRYRKLFQPMHFRFYLASCELRCLVPGLPAIGQERVKKVEMVIRRVALTHNPDSVKKEWAWIDIPAPSSFPAPVPSAVLHMAPRVTGNSRVWWPMPDGVQDLEGEQRFPMSRAMAPGLTERAMYFAFLPLASGEMYGPLRTLEGPPPAEDVTKYQPKNPAELTPRKKDLTVLTSDLGKIDPADPLVPAPSNFPLRPATIASFRSVVQGWMGDLGQLIRKKPIDGPLPKFEPPQLVATDATGIPFVWGYVVRCVATIEISPGCEHECWGLPTEPVVIAPQFDPFGGRPTRIEIPSIRDLAKLVPAGTDLQEAGALSFSIGSGLSVTGKDGAVSDIKEGSPDLCFFGIPLITICAYVMFSLALVIVLPFLSFLLLFKFCLGRRP